MLKRRLIRFWVEEMEEEVEVEEEEEVEKEGRRKEPPRCPRFQLSASQL